MPPMSTPGDWLRTARHATFAFALILTVVALIGVPLTALIPARDPDRILDRLAYSLLVITGAGAHWLIFWMLCRAERDRTARR